MPEGYVSNTTLENDVFTITNSKYRSITVNKYEKNNYDKKLAGAEFKLEKLIEENGEWVVDSNFETQTGITSSESDSLGQIKFENLTYGKYRLTETKAPEGYQLLRKPIEVDVTSENINFNVDIENRKNIILPNTGSNTKIIVLVAGVLVTFIMYRKFMAVQAYSNRSNLRIVRNCEKNKNKTNKGKRKPRILG